MFQLIYSSRSVESATSAAIERLLGKARKRNLVSGVTGLLLYDGAGFLQVLEGDLGDVEATYALIEKDLQHHSLFVLEREPKGAREFQPWPMAFADLTSVTANIPAKFSDPLPQLDLRQAKDYLNFFVRFASAH